MAKKNKFNLNSPSLGQQLVREAMTPYSEGFDISQLPQSYGINEFTTEQEVPVVEEAKDNKRSLAEDIVWNTGKLITNVLDNANPLYQYIQKKRLSVGYHRYRKLKTIQKLSLLQIISLIIYLQMNRKQQYKLSISQNLI